MCQEIRKRFSTVSIPIIMVSAKSNPEHIMKGLEAGSVDYVKKPFHRQELLSRVRAQVRNRCGGRGRVRLLPYPQPSTLQERAHVLSHFESPPHLLAFLPCPALPCLERCLMWRGTSLPLVPPHLSLFLPFLPPGRYLLTR